MPRAGLSREKIVSEAIRIANAEGLAAVTLKRLAADFDVRPPSLFKHVANLAEIQKEMAYRGLTAFRDALRIPEEPGPDARLRKVCLQYRKFARENRGLYEAFQPTHVGREKRIRVAATELLEIFSDLLRPYNLRGREIHALRFLRSALHGFIDLEMRNGFGLPEGVGTSFEFLVDSCLAAVGAMDKT